MDEKRGSRLRPFVLGGLVGGVAGLAAGKLRERRVLRRPPTPPGLAAFEQAPCYEELLARGDERRA